jgi:hypothetical protein
MVNKPKMTFSAHRNPRSRALIDGYDLEYVGDKYWPVQAGLEVRAYWIPKFFIPPIRRYSNTLFE